MTAVIPSGLQVYDFSKYFIDKKWVKFKNPVTKCLDAFDNSQCSYMVNVIKREISHGHIRVVLNK